MRRLRIPPAAIPWAILALALAVRLLTAAAVRQPGYTDAYYYAVGARQLDQGQGFREPFIWNYLAPPDGVPHPGYLYWMPLTAILGWLGLASLGHSFWAMQMPFVLLSALLPLVAYGLALDMGAQRKHAVLAGILAVVPGFYAHFFVLPDNFAPFALAGSLCLWSAGRGRRTGRAAWFGLAGLAAGFGHLARADGLLLLGVALLAAIWNPAKELRLRDVLLSFAACLVGYLAVMGPWFVRNWSVAGSPLPGGGLRTMFLTDYDDMFAYGAPLNLESYLAWGWGAILGSKAQALWLNLQRLWVEGFMIVLLPFSALGVWRLYRGGSRDVLWPFLLYLPLLFVAMTLVFTFPGVRGGLFHSAGALLPFVFATTGPGLEAVVRWAARHVRGWHARQAWQVFAVGLVGIVLVVTGLALWRAGIWSGEWNQRDEGYQAIGQWLEAEGATGATVMVGNAPGFVWHTGHPAVAIPNDPVDIMLAVADRYNVRYLVLDAARPRTTDGLYAGEETDPRLMLRATSQAEAQHWQLYEIEP